jgi:3-oxochol-4-en-24-oyl-CoA dehydrogenase
MGLAITDEHRALAESARAVLSDHKALGAARDALEASTPAIPTYWDAVARLGWLGLHVPEELGGQGFGLLELAVVVEEMGRVVAPGPFLPTALTSAVLAARGDDTVRGHWFPGLADGSTRGAVGLGGTLDLDHGGRLTGDAGAVVGALDADVFVLAVGDDLAVVERAAVHVEPVDDLDPTRRAGTVRGAGVRPTAVLAGARNLARSAAWILAAAEAAGLASACAESATAYAKLRHQFGRPIGSFQAVKHHCADMLVAAELATAAAWNAARTALGTPESELAAAVAATVALPAARRCAELDIQVHGGIAYTWEHDAHLFLRRAVALAGTFGGVDAARATVTDLRERGVANALAIDLPPEAESHRDAARTFLARYDDTPADARRALLARSGYLEPHWPAPFGRAASPVEQLVIEEELAEVQRPELGISEWVIYTLLQMGTADQIDRWIWPSLEGSLKWCQLFSEPDAGSDAAAITTRARRVDGGWSITGQKVWTSDARNCNRGLATVRTDPDAPKHAGITTVAIDMTAAGVDIRPLRELTGDAIFNEVFFDEVFVPDDDVVGEVDGGWTVARATLGNERVSIGSGGSLVTADLLLDLLARHRTDDVGARRAVGDALAEGQALRLLGLRQASRAVSGAVPGPEGNLAKLVTAEHGQRIGQVALDLTGADGVTGVEPEAAHTYLVSRCFTIAGGTSEIVRNVIGERILGLPRG